MELGEYIKKFRQENKYSQADFGKLAGISDGYVCMLEKGRNPRSGKELVPSIEIYNKIAKATGVNLDDLLHILDESPVDISGSIDPLSVPYYLKRLMILADQLNDEGREKVETYAEDLVHSGRYKKHDSGIAENVG